MTPMTDHPISAAQAGYETGTPAPRIPWAKLTPATRNRWTAITAAILNAAGTPMLDERAIAEAVAIRAGDVLIVRCARMIDDAEAHRVRTDLQKNIPALGVVVVLGGVDQLAVCRGAEA